METEACGRGLDHAKAGTASGSRRALHSALAKRSATDYHPTVEDYHSTQNLAVHTLLRRRARRRWFCRRPLFRTDDSCAKVADECADCRSAWRLPDLKRVEHDGYRQRAEIEHGGDFEIDLPLAGDFQIYNALVSAGLAIATGTPAGKALKALEKLKGASGRLELRRHGSQWRAGLCRLRLRRMRWRMCLGREVAVHNRPGDSGICCGGDCDWATADHGEIATRFRRRRRHRRGQLVRLGAGRDPGFSGLV